MVTHKVTLPTFEELECDDIQFGGHVLKAAGPLVGKYCEDINADFMICRQELGIQNCVKEGKIVTKCTLEFFSKLKRACYHELDRYANCLEKSSKDLNMGKCRKTQEVFDKCVEDNLHITRPDLVYFTRPKIYRGNRPPPEIIPEIYDNPLPSPKDGNLPEPKKGNFNLRAYFWR